MKDLASRGLLTLTGDPPIWPRFFLVAPLFFVGTREPDGTYDLAPVHHAMPLHHSAVDGTNLVRQHQQHVTNLHAAELHIFQGGVAFAVSD